MLPDIKQVVLQIADYLYLILQKLYPAHCIEDSWGADLDSQLIRVKDSVLIKKGTETYADSYSAFKDNKKKRRQPLSVFSFSRSVCSESIDNNI